MSVIWITGAHGFIGRHLARFVAKSADMVAGIGHGHWPKTEASEWGVQRWNNGELDSGNLAELLSSTGPPDVVYHLAGGSTVGPSFSNPLEDFNRTVVASARLLDWLRRFAPGVTLVGVSSAAVYGSGHSRPLTEELPLTPYSPYGFDKAMMESLFESYRRSFRLRATVVRLFSVYGCGLRKQLLWDLCTKLSDGPPPSRALLGGTGTELRDWIHVDDVVRLLVVAAEEAERGLTIVNGGSGESVSVSRISQLVCDAWGDDAAVGFSGEARPGDPAYLVANTTRAADLGFRTSVRLVDGLAGYVDWFKALRWRS